MVNSPIGIFSACEGEISVLRDHMRLQRSEIFGNREFMIGSLYNRCVVLVLSHPGKTATALTATLLIDRFKCGFIIFGGVAGSMHPNVKVGDIVIASEVSQHDLDSRPLCDRFEVPDLGGKLWPTDRTDVFKAAVAKYLKHGFSADFNGVDLAQFHATQPTLHTGLIVCGDQFISSTQHKNDIIDGYKELSRAPLACEMEGGVLAVVGREFGIPVADLRVISDSADEEAEFDFNAFMEGFAGRLVAALVREAIACI
ncbi:Phosphorylase superfamily [Carpediemonas membranifera]|uniref:Phosphorylase superfamily n=1 Tax=Carpediemonas membranifera TaxID=201153 RepID=A0A8J6AVC9_9EUKA|nr:Phosphorylase superfamily [Carpediemonas membranifera]|eukprot:KAG9395128.1 Phosphorylase superfamily [Carpediemonas membranifera]